MPAKKSSKQEESKGGKGSLVARCGSPKCRTGPAAEFQDAAYGRDNRVHTTAKSKTRCTVCGTER